MLASVNRLRKPYEINRVYKRGVYGAGEGLISLKAATNGRTVSRAVVVVSKKVDKRAVTRNRIRRRIYEVIRLNTPEGCALDMVFTVFSDQLADAPAETLQKTIIGLLQEAGVVQGAKGARAMDFQEKKQGKPTAGRGIVKPKESSKL